MLRKIKKYIHLNPILRGYSEDWSLLNHHLDTGGHTAHLVFCSTLIHSFVTWMEILNLDSALVNYPVGYKMALFNAFFTISNQDLT